MAGNALEFYDFTVYRDVLPPRLPTPLFPRPYAVPRTRHLTLVTFGVGFLLRPIGARGDRALGRPARPAASRLMISSRSWGSRSAAVPGPNPLLPNIGPAAPLLVLFLAALPGGFALGRRGGVTAFLIRGEGAARPGGGTTAPWQGGSQNPGQTLAGGLVGVVLAAATQAASLDLWGWRVAFLLGTLVLPFGLILRRSLPETLHRPEARSHVQPDAATLRASAPVLRGLALIAASTVPTYVFGYMTTYAFKTLHMPATISLAATVVSGTCGLVGGLIGGALSDRLEVAGRY